MLNIFVAHIRHQNLELWTDICSPFNLKALMQTTIFVAISWISIGSEHFSRGLSVGFWNIGAVSSWKTFGSSQSRLIIIFPASSSSSVSRIWKNDIGSDFAVSTSKIGFSLLLWV